MTLAMLQLWKASRAQWGGPSREGMHILAGALQPEEKQQPQLVLEQLQQPMPLPLQHIMRMSSVGRQPTYGFAASGLLLVDPSGKRYFHFMRFLSGVSTEQTRGERRAPDMTW